MSTLAVPAATAAPPRLFHFDGGDTRAWRVQRILPCPGGALPAVERLDVRPEAAGGRDVGVWSLRGITSNVCGVDRAAKNALVKRQQGPGRPAIARRLHPCGDLGPDEPFDFITWFGCAPSAGAAFDKVPVALCAFPE